MDAAVLAAMEAPRTFHYVFAHRTLPMLAAEGAETLLDALEKDGRSLLRLHWKTTCHALGIEPQPSEAIGYGPGSSKMGVVALGFCGTRTISGYRVGFVQLPLALQVREAHFVAIARRGSETRYLAWESTLEGGARIAEWSITPQGPRGRRIGEARTATGLDDFVAELEGWLGSPMPERPLPTLVPKARRSSPPPTQPSPVVSWSDAGLVVSMLVVWTMMIVVLTLL